MLRRILRDRSSSVCIGLHPWPNLFSCMRRRGRDELRRIDRRPSLCVVAKRRFGAELGASLTVTANGSRGRLLGRRISVRNFRRADADPATARILRRWILGEDRLVCSWCSIGRSEAGPLCQGSVSSFSNADRLTRSRLTVGMNPCRGSTAGSNVVARRVPRRSAAARRLILRLLGLRLRSLRLGSLPRDGRRTLVRVVCRWRFAAKLLKGQGRRVVGRVLCLRILLQKAQCVGSLRLLSLRMPGKSGDSGNCDDTDPNRDRARRKLPARVGVCFSLVGQLAICVRHRHPLPCVDRIEVHFSVAARANLARRAPEGLRREPLQVDRRCGHARSLRQAFRLG